MANFTELPEFVRIKRKRNQDSLQALIFEMPKSKRARNEQFVFKLQRTDDNLEAQSAFDAPTLPLLQQSGTDNDKENTFILPKIEKNGDELPAEFTEMLDSVLNVTTKNSSQSLKRKRTAALNQKTGSNESGIELEYVYDVYYRDKAVHETWEVSRIGYIKFEEDNEAFVNEQDEDTLLHSDDEDSNAEDFYQNDYPEDEDAGNEGDGLEDEGSEHSQQGQLIVEYDELYHQHFTDDNGVPRDFLESLLADEDDESDDDLHSGDDIQEISYKRQNFFPGEEDDDLAIHRDKIFGELERMIMK